MNKLLVICGPTATGKTKLALELARQFNGELISADSRQVYTGLDALTGKDRPATSNEKIWMYDVIQPYESFSVSQYQKSAQGILDEMTGRNKLPIVVGGTGLYIWSLTREMSAIHIPPNMPLRQKFTNLPREVLQEKLRQIDPPKWEIMNESDRQNPRRLIRAVEIVLGQKEIVAQKEQSLDTLWIGLAAPMEALEKRIEQRIRERWEVAVEEVKKLDKTSPMSSTILGLVEIRAYLAGTLTKEEAIQQWITKERQYAKRQLTWFKKQAGIHWLDITISHYQEDAAALVSSWYTKFA